MNPRRLIAAATTLLFLTIWCGPAFAGVQTLVTDRDESGCCCSKEETTKHQTVQDLPCRCASCACSLGDAQPFVPVSATLTVSTTVALAAHTLVVSHLAAPRARPTSTPMTRGPPTTESPPLYLLYDTWLI